MLCTHGMVTFRVFPKAGAFSGALGLPCESSALTQQILQDVLGRLQEAAAGAGLFLLLEGPACLPGSLCIPNLLPRKGVPKVP